MPEYRGKGTGRNDTTFLLLGITQLIPVLNQFNSYSQVFLLGNEENFSQRSNLSRHLFGSHPRCRVGSCLFWYYTLANIGLRSWGRSWGSNWWSTASSLGVSKCLRSPCFIIRSFALALLWRCGFPNSYLLTWQRRLFIGRKEGRSRGVPAPGSITGSLPG